ncbi:diacylglycerol kinase family lipid kinase [candidate division KSB1 bacterium]|nr:diacylglycerol kinase family lipid kinase [candidate division KSB1 bacterium]
MSGTIKKGKHTPMNLLLIFNPRAGSGRAGKLLSPVTQAFQHHNISIVPLVTEFPHHAAELVQAHDLKGFDGIVAAGGDGTLFDVVNGLFKRNDQKMLPVGILPMGTGNAFVRDFPLEEHNWQKAIDIIAANNHRKVDVGKFFAGGKTDYFMNIIGLGFVSDVVDTAMKMKWMGNIAYTIGVFYQMAFLKSHTVHIDLDGIVVERENIFVEISNTRYTSNFYMAPKAKFDDGKFDVTLLGAVNRRKLLKAFPTIFTGEHVNLEFVETYQAKQIHISTDVPKILTPDGELWESTPVQISCLHQALEIFGPALDAK